MLNYKIPIKTYFTLKVMWWFSEPIILKYNNYIPCHRCLKLYPNTKVILRCHRISYFCSPRSSDSISQLLLNCSFTPLQQVGSPAYIPATALCVRSSFCLPCESPSRHWPLQPETLLRAWGPTSVWAHRSLFKLCTEKSGSTRDLRPTEATLSSSGTGIGG